MPRVRPESRPGLRKTMVAGLLATVALTAFPTAKLSAQETSALRGTAGQDGVTETTQTPTDTSAPSDYLPSSAGAEPDDPPDEADPKSTDSLFGEVADPSGAKKKNSAFDDGRPDVPGVRKPVAANADTVDKPPARKSDKKTKPGAKAASDDVEKMDGQATGATRVRPAERVPKVDIGDLSGRAEPIDGHEKIVDDDPFAPLGFRVGSFILRPSIEQGVTATSNADYSTKGKSAVLSESTLRLNAVSDWSRHSASLDAYGNLRETLSGYEIDEKRAGVDAALNLDLADDLRAGTTLTYERAPETASSPVDIAGTAEEPIRQTFGITQSLEKDLGKARFAVTGLLEHEQYGDADLIDGSVLSQKDRDSTLATVTLRGGYEISPALTPFLEAEIGHRFYDEAEDSAGYRRDSDRLGLRAGVEVDLDEKIKGEFSGGWVRERFEDDRLSALEAPSLNAAVTWSPERDTSIQLAASTTVESATDAGESGSILHSGLLTIERKIRSNLTANAILGIGYRDYTGLDEHDLLLSAEVGGTWWLNRYAGITGRLRHEQEDSSPSTRNYDANSVFLGLKLQR